ncbi:hypothetical protein SAMN06296036_110160 [Pseudobacteriovorax antillogorgiicola]|uniref:Uncharacterized protein n=1 Tax=Pseudobacteriovorax antillogorgiicola TaxID=1513793 RepID=A0A1Y6BYK4_9BACT|nr:hypothetical protein EDD56_113161 [Pseudobacteriovorax antillogorgiicola]SMF34767.1 hypothetical protein SAMN06296036_110160 [Pseudobacteriovorax antillogorgiicola]
MEINVAQPEEVLGITFKPSGNDRVPYPLFVRAEEVITTA